MNSAIFRIPAAILFAGVGVGVLFFGNLTFTKNNPGGTDFLARWVGTRLYITQRQNPYGQDTTRAIQYAFYGREVRSGEDEALFAYPFYAMTFFAPFALISDYTIARAVWITFQQMCLAATVVIALQLGRWKPKPLALGVLILFGITWYHGARPLVDGNAAILVALTVALGLHLLTRGADFFAGVLFSLATIKPQMVLLFLILVSLWAVSKRRPMIIAGFSSAMIFLIGGSWLLQPNWIADNVQQILAYQSYLPPMTPAGIGDLWWGSFGRQAGRLMNLMVGVLLLCEWWAVRGKGRRWFLWAASVTLAASPLIGLLSTSSNYAIFLPVLILTWSFWKRKLGDAAGKLVWPEALLVFFGLWIVFLSTLKPGPQFREHEVMFFLIPLFLLANLYGLRSWAQSPQESGQIE